MDKIVNEIAKYVADNTNRLSEADKLLYQIHDMVLDHLEDNYDF